MESNILSQGHVREHKRVVVVDVEQYNADFPPGRLRDFLAWMALAVEQIPKEFRDTAIVEIDSSAHYDSSRASVRISYQRPETDEEWEARKADVMARAHQHEARERAVYEALKAKFK